MKRFLFYIQFHLPILLIGCSEEIKPTPNKYSVLLTGEDKKSWAITAFTIIEKSDKKISYRLNIENSCEDSIDYYDNYYTFYANSSRTLEITEGPEKCSNFPHLDYFFEDTWAIDNATATLTMPILPLSGEFGYPFILKDLTERKMVIEYYAERYIYQFILNPVKD